MYSSVKRTFLFASAVMNLGEVVRMTTLAEAFYNLGHEVIMLGDGHYDYIFSNKGFRREHIPYDRKWWSDERCRMIYNADDYGLNFITEGELDRFVKEEVNLLNRIKPRAVITGFRPTMSVSYEGCKSAVSVGIFGSCFGYVFRKEPCHCALWDSPQNTSAETSPKIIEKQDRCLCSL